MILVPKNWRSFQHYKDRQPPWVKVHKSLLDDRDFARLPIASKALAPMLWLLASESMNGEFNADIDELVFRLRWNRKDVETGLKPLIDMGLFTIASGMLADCLQVAVPETETETETEKRRVETNTPDGVSESIFKDYLEVRKAKKAKWTETALKGLQRESDKANMTLEQVMRICCERNWVGFKAEWLKNEINSVKQNISPYGNIFAPVRTS